MKTLACDICETILQSPIPGRTYFHLAHRDICESCRDKLDYLIKPVVRAKSPFSYEWYTKLFIDNMEKSISKGKVDVKIVI